MAKSTRGVENQCWEVKTAVEALMLTERWHRKNGLKVNTEAQIWKAWRGGSEIQKESWPAQSCRWGIWSWAGGMGQVTTSSPIQPQPFFDSGVLVLAVPKKGKRQLFWIWYLTEWFWSMMFHLSHMKWERWNLFVWVHHLQWLVKGDAVYFSCFCVMSLAQARKKLSQVCRTLSTWSTDT